MLILAGCVVVISSPGLVTRVVARRRRQCLSWLSLSVLLRCPLNGAMMTWGEPGLGDDMNDVVKAPAVHPTIGGSVYVKPQDIAWSPTQFKGISIKVLYEDTDKGELTCLLKWEPGASLPMHKHPEIEQTYVIE